MSGEAKTHPTRWNLAIVVLFACVINYPCLIWGLQGGDDRATHVSYLYYFDQQLGAGDIYPQWLSDINLGAGSPIFYVQYPLPYYVSAALRRMFFLPGTVEGEAHALGLFLFFSGILAGIFCWLWLSRLTARNGALAATLVFLTMPYVYGFDLYHRAALGEYWALAWIPLTFYFLHDLDHNPARAVGGTAFAYAMILLGHPFTAILCAPFIVVYALCCKRPARIFRAGFLACLALLVGAGISGFYFFPMMQQRTHFDMANLIRVRGGNYSYAQHLFPFAKALFPVDRMRWILFDFATGLLALVLAGMLVFQRRATGRPILWKIFAGALLLCVLLACIAPALSWMGLQIHAEMGDPSVIYIRGRVFLITFLTLEAGLLAFMGVREVRGSVPYFLAVSCFACFFLTTRWSAPLWSHLKFLWNLQFPWRLTGLLSLFAVGLLAFLFEEILTMTGKPRQRVLLAATASWLLLAVLSDMTMGLRALFFHRVPVALVSEVELGYPSYTTIDHLPSAEELGSSDGLSTGARVVVGEGTASLSSLSPRHKRLDARCGGNCTVLIRQVFYPTWTGWEGEQRVDLRSSKRAGLTEVQLGAGAHAVDLKLPHSRLEYEGGVVSILSLGVALSLYASGERKKKRKPCNEGSESF